MIDPQAEREPFAPLASTAAPDPGSDLARLVVAGAVLGLLSVLAVASPAWDEGAKGSVGHAATAMAGDAEHAKRLGTQADRLGVSDRESLDAAGVIATPPNRLAPPLHATAVSERHPLVLSNAGF